MTATTGATSLIVVYLLVGAGCVLARGRGAAGMGTRAGVVPLFLFWPLLAPFTWRSRPREAERTAEFGGASDAPISGTAAALIAALRRVADSPLSPLLPDEDTVLRLAGHLNCVSRRVEDLDEVLARPDFDLEAAVARRQELDAAGASGELRSGAAMRAEGIRRLRGVRAGLARELDEVGELLSQLTIQVELVRFAGTVNEDVRSLLRELLGRVDGLSQMLDDQGQPGEPPVASTETHGQHSGS